MPIHEDLLVIKETAEKIVKVLSREIMLNGEYKDARSLSAVFYEYSGLNNIKSRREFLNHFDANQQEVKKIESVLSLNGIEK